MKKIIKNRISTSFISIFIILFAFGFIVALGYTDTNTNERFVKNTDEIDIYVVSETEPIPEKEEIKITRLETPDNVYAVYMTACAASSPRYRERIFSIANDTRINSVVIDIKDYAGTVHFNSKNSKIRTPDDDVCILNNFRDIVSQFNQRGIYTIARLTSFQDTYWASRNLDNAVQKKSDKTLWKDNKGISFVDPSSRVFWEYLKDIAVAGYTEIGFDEINFDYIRFPSDGDLSDTYYPLSEDRIVNNISTGKAEVMEEFFSFLDKELRQERNIPISADIFGQAAINYDDLNIGHILEKAVPYFDAVSLMLYPSHFISGIFGIEDPNSNPYVVVSNSLKKAVERVELLGYDKSVLRPWIQDFDWPVQYDVVKVMDQIKAVDELAIGGWMMWDPSVTYTKEAY